MSTFELNEYNKAHTGYEPEGGGSVLVYNDTEKEFQFGEAYITDGGFPSDFDVTGNTAIISAMPMWPAFIVPGNGSSTATSHTFTYGGVACCFSATNLTVGDYTFTGFVGMYLVPFNTTVTSNVAYTYTDWGV